MIDIGFNPKRVKGDFFEVCSLPLQITEVSKKDGSTLACLTCTFQNTENKEYFRVLQETAPWLQYADNPYCADGIVIESNKLNRCKANLYIIELKTSMGSWTWNDVKKQFRGATLRALAVASALGINEFENIMYITAYVDAQELEETAEVVERQKNVEGLVARKVLPGVKRQEVEEWKRAAIKVFPEQPVNFSHRHVHLVSEQTTDLKKVHVAHITV